MRWEDNIKVDLKEIARFAIRWSRCPLCAGELLTAVHYCIDFSQRSYEFCFMKLIGLILHNKLLDCTKELCIEKCFVLIGNHVHTQLTSRGTVVMRIVAQQ
jgi:hypothetical protein